MNLSEKKCVPCRGDTPPFSKEKIDEYLKYLNDWKVQINEQKSFYLSKVYKFSDFEKSLGFINKVSNIAEEEGHHPDLKFGWGYAEVNIFTHAINGLSLSDFILASKIDMISV
jgi:4a-hydroxytetrahydrobiopterin dehydratase